MPRGNAEWGSEGRAGSRSWCGLLFIEKVRQGRFFSVSRNVLPYSNEALSDKDLGALLAYLGL